MAGLVLLAKSSTGKLTRLQLAPDATVGQLKRELAARFGSEATMRVRAGGQLLVPDDARLRELGVSSQQLLHVDLDPVGGRAPQASAPHRAEAPRHVLPNGEAGDGTGKGRMSASAHEATAVLDKPEWRQLTAKVDAVASELECWTREQINRLQACFCTHALQNLRTIPANIPLVNMTGSSMAVLMLNFNLKSFSTRMEGGRRCVCMRPCQSIIIRQIGFSRSACLVSASASGSASSSILDALEEGVQHVVPECMADSYSLGAYSNFPICWFPNTKSQTAEG